MKFRGKTLLRELSFNRSNARKRSPKNDYDETNIGYQLKLTINVSKTGPHERLSLRMRRKRWLNSGR